MIGFSKVGRIAVISALAGVLVAVVGVAAALWPWTVLTLAVLAGVVAGLRPPERR